MTYTRTILSIDDDKFIHKVIAKTLNPVYNTIFAQTGEEGINIAKMHKPDVIITDVEMPGMNGYEVCEKIKADPNITHIPVVFLSSLDSLQERLSGFESGADDYLVKPFEANDLISKITRLTHFSKEQARLEKKVEEAEKTAYLAMAGSNEIGIAMQLIEQSFIASNIQELADNLLAYAKSKELNCALLIMQNDTPICATTKGAASPLEADLIELLRAEQDRFHDFGCRTQINYPNVSLLINNMPLDDLEEYSRIKDFFTPILAAYDTKIKTLNINIVIREQSITLNESFRAIKETLQSMGESLHENSKSSLNLLSSMLGELNMALPSMGLEADQEEFILSKIEEAV